MCGLAGLVRPAGAPPDRDLVRAMTGRLAHRGPDDEGFHFAPGVGLGHRRLSILDLSADGRQPMANEDATVWIAFNGEIYNQAELRRGLEARGHRFKSRTDTEVLVHLYEERGEALVDDLRGMFAFALWDAPRRRLVLARDRLGIKPLFFAERDGGLVFASEVQALLADRALPRDIDFAVLDAYLAQNYVAAPDTLLRAVRQLEPGELLVWQDAGAGGTAPATVRRRRYWELGYPARRAPLTEAAWLDRLEGALRDAVRTHLMADVPYGTLLSGGVDSPVLTGVLVQEHRAPTLTFTAEFREVTFGEGVRARAVADALGAQNFQTLIDPPTPALLARIVAHAAEPTADMSMIPFYAVCELARRHVKVALSGEGADEILAGYETYPASLLATAYRRVPAALRTAVRGAVCALPDTLTKVSTVEKLKRFARGVEEPGELSHLAWRRICEAPLRRELGVPGAPPPAAPWLARMPEGAGRLDRLLWLDLRYYLPSDMLVKADRMSMAHGLEVRVPYLDHPLVELAASMPASLKLRGATGKWALRRLADRVLPAAARPSRGKRGFNVPMGRWLRGPLREAAGDLLSPGRVARQGLLVPGRVAQVLDEHLGGRRDRTYELYSLLVLSLWHDQVQAG